MAEYIGWGSVPWSEGSWGLDLIEVAPTGVSATVALGSTIAAAGAAAPVIGAELTSAVGSVSVTAGANTMLSGLKLTGYAWFVNVWTSPDEIQDPRWVEVVT